MMFREILWLQATRQMTCIPGPGSNFGIARHCHIFHLDKSVTKDRLKRSWGPGRWRWPDHSCPLKPLALLISAPSLPRGNVSPGFSDLPIVQV